MPKYLIEGCEDGGLFAETIEAATQEEAEAAAVERLCEAWGNTYGPDVSLDDLGDCAVVTEYSADDYLRDAAPAMLAMLSTLYDAASDFAEHGKERHYAALQNALRETETVIDQAGGTPTAQPAAPIPAVYGIAAAPFALFQHSDGQSIAIERHDGPTPERWAINPNRLAAAIEAMLEGER